MEDRFPRARALARRATRAALAATLCAVHAAAAQAPGMRIDDAPPVVVTATALPLSESAVSQHVSVFTRDTIEREAPASVADFLVRRAGIFVEHGARSGGYGSLFLRGADPSHVVVLIDGIRQNDPLSSRGSAVDLNTLTLDDVERIEVVRGNASVVHREALAGVVQIFTRAPRERSPIRLMMEAGGEGLRAAAAALARGPVYASLSHREDGPGSDEGWMRARSANLGYRARRESTGLHAQLRVSDSRIRSFPDDSGGEAHAVVRTLEKRRAESRQLGLTLDHDFGDAGIVELRLARLERDSSQETPRVAPGLRDPFGLPAMDSDARYERNEFAVNWRRHSRGGWDVLLGAGHQSEEGALDSRIDFFGLSVPTDFSIDRSVSSLVAEAYKAMGAWSVQAGLRYEHSPDEEALWHPALGLQYQPVAGGARLGAALSSASKLPSFYALGHPLVGNPRLRPERARQAEIFFASPEAAPWKSRITLFHARYRDLIDFDAGPPPRLVNRSSIHATGLEASLSRKWPHGFTTYAQGTMMRVRDPDGGPRLRLRPERQGSIGLEGEFSPKWRAQWGLTYIGRRLDSSIPTGDAWLGGHATMDLAVTRIGDGWRAFAAVDNLLDREAEETIGIHIGARRLRAGLSVEF